jgi:two-component system NarL family response regulator
MILVNAQILGISVTLKSQRRGERHGGEWFVENPKIRVLIADDEAHIRALLGVIISQLGGEVVALAGDGEEAVRLYEQHRPDLSLLDINMPRLTGDVVMARIMKINPDALVIMLTAQDSVDSVRQCIDLGARNYILKNNPAEKIFELIKNSWAEYVAKIRGEAKE